MSTGAGETRRARIGRRGEELAARWYAEHGYQVLDRNWRCREGEIDLVARRHRTLVFCEVKSRTSERLGTGAEAVTAAKQRRLRRLAGRWLADASQGRHSRTLDVRFDVVSIMAGSVSVIEDAF